MQPPSFTLRSLFALSACTHTHTHTNTHTNTQVYIPTHTMKVLTAALSLSINHQFEGLVSLRARGIDFESAYINKVVAAGI